MKILHPILLTLLGCFCIITVHAQFNIKIGYSGALSNTDDVNRVVIQYNKENDFLKDTLDHLNFLHGIQVGLRYKFKSMGIEIDYESISGSSSAIGDGLNQDLNMNFNGYSLGLENYFGAFGYGSTISNGTAISKSSKVIF